MKVIITVLALTLTENATPGPPSHSFEMYAPKNVRVQKAREAAVSYTHSRPCPYLCWRRYKSVCDNRVSGENLGQVFRFWTSPTPSPSRRNSTHSLFCTDDMTDDSLDHNMTFATRYNLRCFWCPRTQANAAIPAKRPPRC